MNNNYQLFLQRLKEEREQRGLTQQALCRCMKMPQSHYSKAEAGYKRFSFQQVKGLCTSDVDVFYAFTGKKAGHKPEYLEPSGSSLEEITCWLDTIYVLAGSAWPTHRDDTAFEDIRKQLGYIHYLNEYSSTRNDIFYHVRHHCGHTQQKMADMLDMDIKKLRALEKGKLLPDSGIVWKMYDRFQVSPAFMLKDCKGLRRELDYVLSLLADEDRDTVLQILKGIHTLLRRC